MNRSPKNLIPIGHAFIRRNVLQKGNIVGMAEDKAAWARTLSIPPKAEYTLYAGCGYQFMKYAEGMTEAARRMENLGLGIEKIMAMSRFFNKAGIDLPGMAAKVAAAYREDAYTRILISSAGVLRKLGVEIGYMYEDEPCCGSPLCYAGFVDDFIEHATKNYEAFKLAGVRELIGLIPACTSSLRNLYPKYIESYDLKVYHFTEIVIRKLRESKIKPRLKGKLSVTYHDPCQLSRYLDLVEEPREILNSIKGLELREPEPEQCKRWSTCCGGGGVEASNSRLAERLGVKRAEELLRTGATMIVSNCPACVMQLRRSVRKLGAKVPVLDLAEVLDEALD